MKQATLRDLRYNFNHIATLLQEGNEIQITKRKRVIARLLPPEVQTQVEMPDFAARRKAIFGDRILSPSITELLEEERSSRY